MSNPKLTVADKAQAFLANPAKALKIPQRDIKDSIPLYTSLRSSLRNAKRFTLDDEFIKHVVDAASAPPEVMLERLKVVDLPFGTIWVEFNQNVRVDYQYQKGTSFTQRVDDLGNVGYLICRMGNDSSQWESFEFGTVTEGDATKGEIALSVVQQEVCPDNLTRAVFPIGDPNEKNIDLFRATGWGYVGERYNPETSVEIKTLLQYGRTRPDIILVPAVMQGKNEKQTKSIADLIVNASLETRGDLRFLVTLISMLNMIPDIQYEYRPVTGKFLSHTKSISYLDTNIVHLHIGRKKIVNLLRKKTREHIKKRG